MFATLARNFDVDVNILSGSVEIVGDRRVGQFHIELEGEKITQALKYLHEAEFEVEVHRRRIQESDFRNQNKKVKIQTCN
nr:NIL domain-containing protein [Dendronalium sp. ChiSLP03b]MDZ8208734.1 NIL domain-containing protein [Dendronalium sp. ChiSLP03b]